MAMGASMIKTSGARLLIILGVLLSLCVSDNVGPRLLPLPLTPELVSAPTASDHDQATSHTPAHDRTETGRIEMVSPAQSRLGAGQQPSQVAANTPRFELTLPSFHRSLRHGLYSPCTVSSALLLRPEGRAPPRLV
jgi:hypothetical protein